MRQRQPRQHDPAFLSFVRKQICCVCLERHPVEAAHIRMASPERGKRSTGMQEKPDDKWAVPLCPRQHRLGRMSQHAMGERDYWKMVGIDPFAVAEQLYAQFDSNRPVKPQRLTITIKGRKFWRSERDIQRERQRKSKPIQNRSAWPPKGSRAIASRGFR